MDRWKSPKPLTNMSGRGELDAIHRTQGYIIQHVRSLDGRVRVLETRRRRPAPSKVSVSMIIDWRMITALVILIMGMSGLFHIEELKELKDMTLTISSG